MRRYLLLSLMASALLATLPAAADIVPVEQNGKIVWVDVPAGSGARQDQPAAQPNRVAPRRVLMYWSRTEKRWKRVPPASGSTMRAARSAVADVNQYLQWRAQQPAFRVNYGENDPAPAPQSAQSAEELRKLTPQQLDAIIEEASLRHGVDSNLVRALIKVESNFNPRAVSHKGAMGLMQLMPGTARSLKVANPFDPQQNVDGGVRHLKKLLQDFNGDVELATAAYNAGAGAVQRHDGVPPYRETRNYVRRIQQLYGGNGGTGQVRGTSAPIRVYRDAKGTLTFTND